MKTSLHWLNDFVDLEDYFSRAGELAQLLTSVGFEVESLENPGAQLKNVVVGQIKTLDRHPNADRLTLCQVDVGDGTLRQIVCGAKNHKATDKVVVALPGAVLPGNFEIKKSKIRDVESQGMLASESELGLKKESEGILILPADAPVGESFVQYYKLDDVLLDVNVTPNRADCLSHLGLARELAAILNRPLKERQVTFAKDPSLSTRQKIQLRVKDSKLCSRYSGRLATGVKVGPSPDWLKKRLESVGLNSINNVVDITNYVMMEVGQPMHAFDLDQLQGSLIEVDKARAGEKFVTLDGTELALVGTELTIRDGERAVCLAGVVGGKNSGVSDKTESLFLESAHFAMDSVRKTARQWGLQTDSAYRFSRGTDASGTVKALDLACSLLEKWAGARIAGDCYDEYPAPTQKSAIAIQIQDVSGRLGFAVDSAEFKDWMKRLGCDVKDQQGGYLVTPPLFRNDLEMKEDLIEEFGRLHGYDRIPEELPQPVGAPLAHAPEYSFNSRLGGILEHEGFSEAINYGFVSGRFQKEFLGTPQEWLATGLSLADHAVGVRNPLNEELNVMRLSLAPWLYRNFVHNYRHGLMAGRLFESGYVFHQSAPGAESAYGQSPRLGILAWGGATDLWQKADHPSYYELKTCLENLFYRLRVGAPKGLLGSVSFQSLDFRKAEWLPPFLHPAQSAIVFCEGRAIGYVGSLHPRLLLDEKMTCTAAIAEIDVTALSRGQPRPIKFQGISKFPAVERDFAFLVPDAVMAAAVAGEIRKISGAHLQSLEVFDVFAGASLPAGHRSLAYRLVFQDASGTLTEPQLQGLQNEITKGLEQKLNVRVR